MFIVYSYTTKKAPSGAFFNHLYDEELQNGRSSSESRILSHLYDEELEHFVTKPLYHNDFSRFYQNNQKLKKVMYTYQKYRLRNNLEIYYSKQSLDLFFDN